MSSPSSSSQSLLRPDVAGLRTQSSASGTSISGISGTSPPGAGGIPNIPLPASSRRGSHSAAGAGDESSSSRRPTPSPHPSSSNVTEELTDEQKAAIVGRHLVGRQGQRRASRKASNVNASGVAKGGGCSTVSREGEEEEEEAVASDEEVSANDDDDEDARRVRRMQESTDEFPMPFGLQGGDITHELYKWQRNALAQQSSAALKRSKSTGALSSVTATLGQNDETAEEGAAGDESAVAGTSAAAVSGGEGNDSFLDPNDPTLDYKQIRTPGGFRRNFIARQGGSGGPGTPGQNSGTSSPAGQGRSRAGSVAMNGGTAPARPGMPRATSSFIEFLSLYGHYAGETLEEIEEGDDEEEDEEEALRAAERGIPTGTPASRNVNERTPLLKRTDTRARIARTRLANKGQRGEATVTQAVMMLLKSFVGTGVLFLGRAFANGGMLFSTVVMLSIAMISLYSFLLLVDCRLVVPGSFGDMGGVLYGPWLRIAILTSITLSQIGFVAAYTIFVAENLVAFTLAVSNCRIYIPVAAMIFAQIIFYLPLAMFRNIQKLSGTALIADAFILIGIVYIFSLETIKITKDGFGPGIVAFNSKSFSLLVGTAVFAFEGVGLVIPITEAMKEPEKFPRVLTGCMVGVALLFGGAGALGYAAFGKDIQTVVLVNLPQDDRFVNVVQLLYSIAIMLSTPLQLFPAMRIMEQGIFSEKSGKYSNRVKWQKNLFRSATVVGCALVSWAGASSLEVTVAIVGSTACVPLCFIYPPLLWYKACAKTWRQRAIAVALIAFGALTMVFTSVQTIKGIMQGDSSPQPNFGKCPTPA